MIAALGEAAKLYPPHAQSYFIESDFAIVRPHAAYEKMLRDSQMDKGPALSIRLGQGLPPIHDA